MVYARPVNGLGLDEFPSRTFGRSPDAARVRGELVKFDLGLTSSSSLHNRPNDISSGLYIVVDVTAAARRGRGVLGVCEGPIAQGERNWIKSEGFVKALVNKASGAIAVDDPLAAHEDGYLTADLQAGDRIVAFARETATPGGTATLIEVVINGLNGGATVV